MTGVSISMQGADSAHLRALNRREGRLLRFPDGVDRLIVLRSWYWRAFDSLWEQHGHCEQEVLHEAFAAATEWKYHDPDRFEDDLRGFLRRLIQNLVAGDRANDNLLKRVVL